MNTLFPQHKNYTTVPWVLCTLCQAKKAVPEGGSTTGLLRHIEKFHPEKAEKKKKNSKGANIMQSMDKSKVSEGKKWMNKVNFC